MKSSRGFWVIIVILIVIGISILWNKSLSDQQIQKELDVQINKDEILPYSFNILNENEEGIKELELYTRRKVRIRATDYGGNSTNNVILLHQENGSRKDYNNFAYYLKQNNLRVISLDFRGYGESEGNKNNFTYIDYESMTRDIEVVQEYLINKTGKEKVSLLGSELGANIATNYVYGDVDKLLLVSPLKEINEIESDQIYRFKIPVMMIGASGDKEVTENIRELEEEISKQSTDTDFSKTIIISGNKRGIEILSENKIKEEILSFLLA